MTRCIPVLLLIIAGCGNKVDKSDNTGSDYSPTVIIQFRDIGISPRLPWDISSGRNNVSASMLLPDTPNSREDDHSSNQLVTEALENDLFVALISDSCLDYEINRDHIRIWVDSGGNVRSQPEELLDGISGTAWLNNTNRQDVLLELFDMYKPDLILMVLRIPDLSSVLKISEYWTAPDILSRYRIVLFSISENPDTRGWCVFAGEGINGSTPSGITRGGLFSTIQLLAGLRWADDLPGSVPALSIFEDTNDIWSYQ
ncbi:MAG: hypothetical protein K8S15_04705 [Candidatus Aegiribacteria sp.]|nr:hypothetical protein [Candidatus Aegiribacteria sp.]